MDTMRDRLSALLKTRGMKTADLAEALPREHAGYVKGQALYKFLEGRTKKFQNHETVVLIAQILNVEPNWLEYGQEVPAARPTATPQQRAASYVDMAKAIPNEGIDAVIEYLEGVKRKLRDDEGRRRRGRRKRPGPGEGES